MRVKSYKEAVNLARSAGEDAANRRMRKAGRKSEADLDHAAGLTHNILADLGFDIAGWVAMAGVPRNEPEVPTKKPKRRSKAAPVQMSFAFA